MYTNVELFCLLNLISYLTVCSPFLAMPNLVPFTMKMLFHYNKPTIRSSLPLSYYFLKINRI